MMRRPGPRTGASSSTTSNDRTRGAMRGKALMAARWLLPLAGGDLAGRLCDDARGGSGAAGQTQRSGCAHRQHRARGAEPEPAEPGAACRSAAERGQRAAGPDRGAGECQRYPAQAAARPLRGSGQASQRTVVGHGRCGRRGTGQPSGADQAAYNQAFDILKAGKYADAITAFQQFLQTYPQSSLADNAQYWLGESYYVTRDFQNAAAAFQTVLDRWPDSRKAPDALLKLGYTQAELGAHRPGARHVELGCPPATRARMRRICAAARLLAAAGPVTWSD